jgi:hypothetical protein
MCDDVDQWDYVLQFAAAGVEQQRVERERIAAIVAGAATVAPALAAHPVVLDARLCDVDDAPASARRLAGAASAAGWRAKFVWALAADPRRGLVESVTVRLTRHDERCFAAWWNRSFQGAWYFSSSTAPERLGWRTTVKIRSVLDAVEGIQLTRQVVDTMIGR